MEKWNSIRMKEDLDSLWLLRCLSNLKLKKKKEAMTRLLNAQVNVAITEETGKWSLEHMR